MNSSSRAGHGGAYKNRDGVERRALKMHVQRYFHTGLASELAPAELRIRLIKDASHKSQLTWRDRRSSLHGPMSCSRKRGMFDPGAVLSSSPTFVRRLWAVNQQWRGT